MTFAQEALGVDDDEPESVFGVDGVVLDGVEESELLVDEVVDEADEPEELDEPRASFL